jgi:hypothetical protein
MDYIPGLNTPKLPAPTQDWNPPGTGGNGRGQFAAQQTAAQIPTQDWNPVGTGGNGRGQHAAAVAAGTQGPGGNPIPQKQRVAYNTFAPQPQQDGSAMLGVGDLDTREADAGYRNMAATGGVNEAGIAAVNNQFDAMTGANGGFAQGDIDAVRAARDAAANQNTNINALGGLQELGASGGISPDVRAGVQRDYIKQTEQDGGLSADNIARIRAKAARSAPGTFGAVKSQLDNQRAVTGGTTGLASTDFKLARGAAQQQAQDSQDAEIGLAESIRAGKMDASKTLSGNELNMLGESNRTRLGALGTAGGLELGQQGEQRANQSSAANIGLAMQDRLDSTRLAGMSSKQQGTLQGEELAQKGKTTGLGGLSQNATNKTQLAIQKASGIDAASSKKIDQLLQQANSKDQNAIQQANLGLQRATGMDAVSFQNVSQQLQQAAGVDAATASNTMLALQKAQGLDASAKDKLMAEIAKASGIDQFTLGSVQAMISKASASNSFNLGMGGLNLQQAGMQDDYNLNQQSLAQSAANAGAAGDRASQADRMRMEQYLLDSRLQGQQFGLGGLGDLRTSRPEEQLAYDQLQLDAITGRSGNANNNRSLSLTNNANNPGFGKQVVGALGGLAQAGAAAYGARQPGITTSDSDRNIKEHIEEVNENIVAKFKRLPISTWNYIGDTTKHLGPMAQDMQEIFGIGDGKTIALVDVMGLLMLLGKTQAEGGK